MKKLYTLVGLVLVSGTTMAQLINRPHEFMTSEKHAPNAITTINGHVNNSGDRAIYYSEDFDATTVLDGSEGWTADEQSGNVGFELTSTGHANSAGSSFTIPAMNSTTPTQWIVLDSDSQGQSGTDEDATLTSEPIDLTINGATNGIPLKLEFEQFFAEWEQAPNYDTLYVGVSDDGITWNEVQISNEVGREGRPNPETISLNITPYNLDVTQVQIRFRWDGNWAYGWQIDNVSIQDLPPNDIAVSEIFRGDIINNYMYSKVPSDQATEFVIGLVAVNLGFNDQTDIGFDWTITDPNMGVSTGSSTANIASLMNAEKDTIWVSTGVTPTILGNYTIDFEVTSAETDDEVGNNTASDGYYELTTDVFGADYGDIKTSFANWGGNNNGAASIGNIFLIQTDGVVGAIDAELYDNVDALDQVITYTIYKYNAIADEFAYIAETEDYTTESGDEGSIIRIFFDEPIDVVTGDQILACAGHSGGDPSAAFSMGGSVPAGQVAGYNESSTATDLISSLANPSAAIVRMIMTDFTTVEENEIENKFSIYPNPANNELNVNITSNSEELAVVNVLDVTGKIVKTINVNGSKTVTLNVEELTTGVYFVELITDSGKEVKKFIKK